jgi:REP element-mobilizing transposase RayT
MPSTYLSLHYHLIFATKERLPLIDSAWRARLHEYLGGTIRGLGGFPEGIGGIADHVHLLMGLKATHRLSDVMRELKKRPHPHGFMTPSASVPSHGRKAMPPLPSAPPHAMP